MRKPSRKISDVKLAARQRRRLSTRKKLVGSEDRPRLCVTKSNKHLLVQAIDDSASKTLFSVQSFGKNAPAGSSNTKEGAKVVGAKVAEQLKAKKLEKAIFDRAGNRYHGVIASLVDSIRENGIQI